MRNGLATAGIVATAAALLAGCAPKAVEAPRPRPVVTLVAGAQTAQRATVYSGEVRARYENDLAFRIGGKVVARHVEVGSAVSKGALLARLDAQDAQLAVESAAAQVAAIEADHTLARAELERYRALIEKKFVSQAVLDAKQNAFNATRARLEQARAQLAASRNQSGYTALYAERDGVITAVNIEPGQVVAAGQSVMRIARPEEKEVAVSVPEGRVAELREAKEVLVRLWANDGTVYRGRVREIAPYADPATRTFAARITIENADGKVALGMTANVVLPRNGKADDLLLPATALAQQDGRPAVWVVDPRSRTVHLRPVEVSAYREDGVAVSSGLSGGEIIVAAGVHKLVTGQAVRLETDAPATRTAGSAARSGG